MLATLEAKIVAGFVGFGIIFAALFGAYHYGTKVKGTSDALAAAKLKLATDQLILDSKTANDTLISQLEALHEQNDGFINILAAEQPVGSMRLPSNTCSNSNKASASSRGQSISTASGVPFTEAERILGADRQRTWAIEVEAEKALNQCRVVMDWAKTEAQSQSPSK